MGEYSPDGVDLERANVARMYDFLLGSAHNFAIDREHVATLLRANPEVELLARSNRSYLGRVVRWCVTRGIDQFLDLGSGVPTMGNVHEVARAANPGARVAYVDIEPVAVAHSRKIVADLDGVTITQADLRDPGAVLAAPGVAGLLHFDRPLALLAVSCLHFLPGALRPVISRYIAELAPGSVVALSHASSDVDDEGVASRMQAMATAFAGSASPQTLRDRAELATLLGDLELVEPGVVDIAQWPDEETTTVTGGLAAVAVVPRP